MRIFLFLFCSIQLLAANVLREISANDVWVEIHLNDHADVTALVFPDASRIQYDYINRRLCKITRFNRFDEETYSQIYEWDQAQLIRQTGWFSTQYTYDDQNRVISKCNPWYQGTMEYDTQGLPVRVGDRFYTYDPLGQITSEQGYFDALYDNECNLLELNRVRIEVDSQNQISGLSYDAHGNLLKPGFIYDNNNQLVEACGESYEYDSLGRRIKKGNTTYLYLGFEELGAFENGQCKTLRIPGIGGPIAIEINGKPYAPVIDAQGIIRKLIDPETNLIYREIDCDIFGRGLTDEIPYAYRGKRYDQETNLIYFGRRYYDPSQQRFLTRDPLGAIDHENLYQYVYNNPLLYWDPTGENFWGYMVGLCEIAAGGAIITGGVGLELVTLGGFTFGVGLTTSTGAALIGHGLATTTYHAYDIKFPDTTWKSSEKEYKKPKPHISGKEGAKDIPSWAKGNRPFKEESGKDFAERLLDQKYGAGKYDKGPGSPFNQIKKWGDRAWE